MAACTAMVRSDGGFVLDITRAVVRKPARPRPPSSSAMSHAVRRFRKEVLGGHAAQQNPSRTLDGLGAARFKLWRAPPQSRRQDAAVSQRADVVLVPSLERARCYPQASPAPRTSHLAAAAAPGIIFKVAAMVALALAHDVRARTCCRRGQRTSRGLPRRRSPRATLGFARAFAGTLLLIGRATGPRAALQEKKHESFDLFALG